MSNKKLYDFYHENMSNYYRDYKDYLASRRCCKGSIKDAGNFTSLGRQKCCSNNISKYYTSYEYFLRDKNCCSKLVILDAYKN